MKARRFLCLLLWLVFPAASPAESTLQKDVSYLPPERAEKLDVYLPSAEHPRPLPAVLLIHGGGWRIGDKADKLTMSMATQLSDAGYAVFSVNYHLAPSAAPKICPWPQNFYDCKSALRFIRKEAATFGIDPSRIGVAGPSAGGHLALLVGFTAHVNEWNQGGEHTEQSNDVACIVNLYGVPNLAEIDPKLQAMFPADTPEAAAEKLRQASPVTYLDAKLCPVLIIHGDQDEAVPVSVSRNLAAHLKQRGAEYEYLELPNRGHAFPARAAGPALMAFLDKHLRH